MATIKAWTDYPITELGDTSGQESPARECEVLAYDGDRYCQIGVGGVVKEVKAGYLYSRRGRVGAVPALTEKTLQAVAVRKP